MLTFVIRSSDKYGTRLDNQVIILRKIPRLGVVELARVNYDIVDVQQGMYVVRVARITSAIQTSPAFGPCRIYPSWWYVALKAGVTLINQWFPIVHASKFVLYILYIETWASCGGIAG